jgi:hypothetical protein
MVVLDSNRGEVVHRHRTAGVMGFPLVALFHSQSLPDKRGQSRIMKPTGLLSYQ